MVIQRGDIYWTDLNPGHGTEAGKIRPVVVVQTDMLNQIGHLSTLICPCTTQLSVKPTVLRVRIPAGHAGLDDECEVLIDQLRAIDNTRLRNKAGVLPYDLMQKVERNLKTLLDLL